MPVIRYARVTRVTKLALVSKIPLLLLPLSTTFPEGIASRSTEKTLLYGYLVRLLKLRCMQPFDFVEKVGKLSDRNVLANYSLFYSLVANPYSAINEDLSR